MNRLTYHFNKIFNPTANDELFKRYGKTIKPEKFPFFYTSKFYVWPLVNEIGCDFTIVDGKLNVLLDDISVFLTNDEEIFIFYEVFYKKQYAFSGLSNPVVFDIGFNIGLSSIFFKKYCAVERILAFEPVPETLEAGIANIKASSLSKDDKLQVLNYGLSDQDKALLIPYDRSRRGSNGLVSFYTSNDNLPKIEIQLRDIYSVLQPINGDNIVFKIDCEGGEYEIVRRMDETGMIRKGVLYMMEWHEVGQNSYKELISIFERNRFVVIATRENKIVGMIFAYRLA